MPAAPCGNLIHIRGSKLLAGRVAEKPARARAVRQLPHQGRRHVQQIRAGILPQPGPQRIRPGQNHIGMGIRVAQLLGMAVGAGFHAGLVGKDGRYGAAEILAHLAEIGFMRHGDERADGLRIHHIRIGCPLEPVLLLQQHHIGPAQPFLRQQRLLRLDPPGAAACHGIGCGKPSARLSALGDGPVEGFPVRVAILPALLGQKQKTLAKAFLPGQQASRRAGGKAVVIVEPAQQALLLALLYGEAHQAHVFPAQIGRVQAAAGMDVHPAKAHGLENIQLLVNQLLGDRAVP